MNKKQICSVCGNPILKSNTGNVEYNIDKDGRIICEACEKKRQRIAEMEKTFDEPLHRM